MTWIANKKKPVLNYSFICETSILFEYKPFSLSVEYGRNIISDNSNRSVMSRYFGGYGHSGSK
jgi:hypothetical protein